MGLFNNNKQEDVDRADEQSNLTVAEETEGIKTNLSYHPDWNLTVQEKYVYQFKHQKLPFLQPNQISISGINLYEADDSFVITAFLRSTLPNAIRFEIIDLILVDDENKPIARKRFEMDLFGPLPSNTARPWRFLFSKEDLLVEELPKDNWKLAFELKKHGNTELELDLDESWKDSLTEDKIELLKQKIKQLPPINKGELNFAGIEAGLNNQQDLVATLLIRNSSDQKVTIDKLPLVFEDASGESVASGHFQLSSLEVKPNTCKPWLFIFPANSLQKENPDLSAWKVYVPSDVPLEINQ